MGEAFGFLGFDLRRVHKRKKDGYTIQMTPKKKARKVVKAKIRDIIRSGGATPVAVIVARVNAVVAGWVNYFRVGSRAFSEVRDYLEMKIRTLLTRRKGGERPASDGGDGVTRMSTACCGYTGIGKSIPCPPQRPTRESGRHDRDDT
jgi:hypothetical protein